MSTNEFFIELFSILVVLGAFFLVGFLAFNALASQYNCVKTYHPRTDALQSIHCKLIKIKKS